MSSVLKLVVGLGNPGTEYAHTRHNAGFMAVDALANHMGGAKFKRAYRGKFVKTRYTVIPVELGLLKPHTYMNRSGQSVARAASDLSLTPEDIIVVHDDLDLPLGRIKVKAGGGTGGHNGIESVRDSLRSADFIRIRIGIDKPEGDATDYVLGKFRTDETVIMVNDVLPRAVEAILTLLKEGPQKAMNDFNG